MGLILRLLGPFGIAGAALSIALGALLGLQVHKTHAAQADATSWQLKFQGEHGAFLQTVINYSQAAEKAREADAANVARVRAEQAAINERTSNEYEARLADARARAGRLSQREAAAHQGSSAAADVSRHGSPSGSVDGSAAQDGFSVADRLTATEQAIQLDELIKWVKGQLKVDMNGGGK